MGGNDLKTISICILSIFMMFGTAIARPTASITIKAIDEHGAAVENAKVTVGFVVPDSTGIGTNEVQKNGITGNNGEFSASSESMNSLGFIVDKEEYYQSSSGFEFTSISTLGNRWEPWNPTVEVVLKKKSNPVPMYKKGTDWIEVPAQNISVGYDLETGDWVAPYGTGLISDFIFVFAGEIKAYREYDLKMVLNFSHDLDGVQEYLFSSNDQSSYKWPYDAPVDGYQKELTKEIHKIPGKTETNINREAKYIFRVRTQTDASGKIISAKYGKISSEFELSPDGSKFLIRFQYAFNPDGTRNLEEDPEKNLFKK